MRNRVSSILVVGVVALTMTGCSGAPNNTDACRDLLNIQGELEALMSDAPDGAEEARETLLRFAELARAAHSTDADGEVKTAATSLGNVVEDWHDALKDATEEDAVDDPINSSLAASYVDADLDVRTACSQFLP